MKLTNPGTMLLLLLAIGIFSFHAKSLNFTQDDSYIFFRYAKNFANGNGLVFNKGECVEGYTSFTWTLILAVVIKLGIDPVIASKILGFMFSLGSFVLLFLISRLILKKRPFVFNNLAALMLAWNGFFAMWTLSGMETPFFNFLCLCGIYAYLHEHYVDRKRMLSAVIFALASLTRPEGVFLFGLTYIHSILSSIKSKQFDLKRQVHYGGLFIILLAPFFLWRIHYYGYPFPNTFYAKTGWSWLYLKMGLDYTYSFLKDYALWGLAVLVPCVVLFYRRDRFWLWYVVLLIISNLFYVTMIGGDVLLENRFFILVSFLMYLIVQEFLYDVYRFLCKRRDKRELITEVSFQSCILLIAALYSAWTFYHPRESILKSKALMEGVVEKYTQIAAWINKESDRDVSLATTGVGAISYLTDIKVIDMYGMTDEYIAHHPARIPGLVSTTKEQNYNVSYVMQRDPTYIAFITNRKPAALAEKALFTSPEFRQAYYLYRINDSIGVYVRKEDYSPKPQKLTAYRSIDFIEEFCSGLNIKREDANKALKHLRNAIELGPQDFPQPYEQIGFILLDQGLNEEAARYFGRAVEIDDYCPIAHYGLSSICQFNKEFEKAEYHLNRAIRAWPHFAQNHYSLGKLYVQLSQFDKARKAFLESIRLDETFPYPYLELGSLYADYSDNQKTAVKYFERFLSLQPQGEVSQSVRKRIEEIKQQQ